MLSRLSTLFPFTRLQVEGESMAPAYSPGERVLVNRAAYWFATPRPGDPVVVRDPRKQDRLLLKRIDRPARDGGWLVLGDNSKASTDSRTFGPVDPNLIVGKVFFRY